MPSHYFKYIRKLVQPLQFTLPGLRLGLANSISLIALYFLPLPQCLTIVFLRTIITGLFTGRLFSLAFSLTGGLASLLAMATLKKMNLSQVSIVGISALGSFAHNLGQVTIAALFTQSWLTFNYLPFIALAGLLTSLLTGLLAQLIIKHFKSLGKVKL